MMNYILPFKFCWYSRWVWSLFFFSSASPLFSGREQLWMTSPTWTTVMTIRLTTTNLSMNSLMTVHSLHRSTSWRGLSSPSSRSSWIKCLTATLLSPGIVEQQNNLLNSWFAEVAFSSLTLLLCCQLGGMWMSTFILMMTCPDFQTFLHHLIENELC